MNFPDYDDYKSFREALLADYAPTGFQERLLVHEVAASWRRLEECRQRERLFFDLQRARAAAETGEKREAFNKEGAEVVMWFDKPQRAYDQILRAIRDAEIAFDKAVKRIEATLGRRFKREQVLAKQAAKPASRAVHRLARAAGDPLPEVVDIAAARRPAGSG